MQLCQGVYIHRVKTTRNSTLTVSIVVLISIFFSLLTIVSADAIAHFFQLNKERTIIGSDKGYPPPKISPLKNESEHSGPP